MQRNTRRNFLQRAGLGSLSLIASGSILSGLTCSKSGKPAKPNVIYILADDLGYGDLGSYGQQQLLTPHIDKLTAEGMKFTQHYSGHPVCAPSRCTLMTGKHTGHASRRSNRPYIPVQPDETVVAELFKQAGYRTGIVGKWGLSDTPGDFDPGTMGQPNKRGFDYWFGFLNQKHAWDYYTEFVWENGEKWMNTENRYMHDVFTEKALDFIRTNQQEPFYLYLPFTIPHVNNAKGHTPEAQQVPDDSPYTDRDWPQAEKNFASMITRLDTSVGQVLQLLEKLGLSENTIVMFSSDNGAQGYAPHSERFFNGTGGLRGKKGDVYEGGIRIPFIVKWPGVIEPGSTSDHISAFWDFMPTAADIIGVGAPTGIDGISFYPTLVGKPQPEHDYLYWEFPARRYAQAIRKGDWKAVKLEPESPIELYNLANDVNEEHNVAGQYPELVEEMRQLFTTARYDTEHWKYPEGAVQ